RSACSQTSAGALILVSDVIAGIAQDFGVMLAARAVLGVGVGGVWVFRAGAAISLVSEPARGPAMAVVSSGIFIATVASRAAPRCRGWAPAAGSGRGRC